MLAALLVVLCVVFRVIPHPPNFAPVGATAVFAGRTLKPRYATALVILAMFVGDMLLARFHGYSVVSAVTPFVYAGFVVQTFFGRVLRARKGGAIAAALLGSIGFFLLSNFGVWVAGGMYARDASGLLLCYSEAIPFFGPTVLGDLLWTIILALAYRPLAKRLALGPSLISVPTEELALV